MNSFIVLEGLDATGKSTVATLLGQKPNIELLSTPPSALKGVRPLLDSTYRCSGLASQLFYASTVAYVSAVAKNVMNRGLSAVADRYWISTLVYNELRLDSVDLSMIEEHLTPATLTVLLYTSEEERRRRLSARGATDADLESLKNFCLLQERFERFMEHPIAGSVLRLDTSEMSPQNCVDAIERCLELR